MNDEVYSSFNDYVRRIVHACRRHCVPDGLYGGVEGCKRLAREIGCALPDFSRDERIVQDMISRTYSSICVIVYNLKPPVDAGDWIKAMREGVSKRK